MSTNITQEIKTHLGAKSTEELLDIWVEHDREKWSVEYFEAVRLILLERNETIPNQNDRPKVPEPNSRNKKMRNYAVVLLLVGAGSYILLSLFIYMIIDLLWPGSSMFELFWYIRNFLVLLCVMSAIALFILSYTLKESK